MAELPSRATRAEIIPPDLLNELLVAVDDPDPALYLRFGGEAPAPFAHRLEKKTAAVRIRAGP